MGLTLDKLYPKMQNKILHQCTKSGFPGENPDFSGKNPDFICIIILDISIFGQFKPDFNEHQNRGRTVDKGEEDLFKDTLPSNELLCQLFRALR